MPSLELKRSTYETSTSFLPHSVTPFFTLFFPFFDLDKAVCIKIWRVRFGSLGKLMKNLEVRSELKRYHDEVEIVLAP